MPGKNFLGGVFLFLLAVAVHGAEVGLVSSNRFELKISSLGKIEFPGKSQTIGAFSEFTYSLIQTGNSVSLLLHGMSVSITNDALGTETIRVSRAGFANDKAGKINRVAFDEAPPPLRKMLTDTFDTVLCVITVDRHGAEVKREIVAGPGAANALNSGAILNARLFHAPFLESKTEWNAERELSAGAGRIPRGQVAFEREASKSPGASKFVPVRVSGTLMLKEDQAGGPVQVKNAVWKLTGSQLFNSEIKEWESGSMAITYSHDVESGGTNVGSSSGRMQILLKRLVK